MKKLKFIRWGGLSPVIQKERFVPDSKLEEFKKNSPNFTGSYHRPPCRKGCYAFPENIIEMFLVAWKIYEKEYDEEGNSKLKKQFLHPKKFTYSGKLWTHIYIVDPEIKYYRKRDSWYETDTDSYELLLKKYQWQLSKEISTDYVFNIKEFSHFVKGWKHFSKDSFEVFIERI